MAVNQAQVDHIITAASEDDPEVKLQNLEREVDLIKTSIKRLLMDIRERMNELENPFTLSATGGAESVPPVGMERPPQPDAGIDEAKKSAMDAREAALDARQSQLVATEAKIASEKKAESAVFPREPVPIANQPGIPDEQILALLRGQIASPQRVATGVPVGSPVPPVPPTVPGVNEKLRLQKVYKLFKWTNQSVKKFGHDRLEIMLESYRAMGYLSKESSDEIREISRLMPANLGEEHEVGPDEFVAELYALNRILSPTDTSLDRDMIEVMMEKRQAESPAKDAGERMEYTGSTVPELPPVIRKKDKTDEWMNLPDRI